MFKYVVIFGVIMFFANAGFVAFLIYNGYREHRLNSQNSDKIRALQKIVLYQQEQLLSNKKQLNSDSVNIGTLLSMQSNVIDIMEQVLNSFNNQEFYDQTLHLGETVSSLRQSNTRLDGIIKKVEKAKKRRKRKTRK